MNAQEEKELLPGKTDKWHRRGYFNDMKLRNCHKMNFIYYKQKILQMDKMKFKEELEYELFLAFSQTVIIHLIKYDLVYLYLQISKDFLVNSISHNYPY